jgi:hypothetical protein
VALLKAKIDQYNINREMCTVYVVFQLFCSTSVSTYILPDLVSVNRGSITLKFKVVNICTTCFVED